MLPGDLDMHMLEHARQRLNSIGLQAHLWESWSQGSGLTPGCAVWQALCWLQGPCWQPLLQQYSMCEPVDDQG